MPDKDQLRKLYFGKDDAESDIASGGLLRAGFLRTRAYEEALSGSKSLIIGRKGSGKSAICLTLVLSLKGKGQASMVSPDEISAEEIRRFQLPGIQPAQSKQLIWRYIFAIQTTKFLLNRVHLASEVNEAVPPEAAALRKFLLDNGEVDDPSFIERFWKVVERLKGSVSLEAFGVKVGGELQHPSPGVRANDQLDVLEKRIANLGILLNLADQNICFHLLVDQIEKVWSNDIESDAMVVGLLQASKDVRARLDWIRCTVFLRADIYEKLQFQDRDKFRGDEFHIDWNAKQLSELIEARAAASDPAINASLLWSTIFPKEVAGQPSKAYIIGRTLMRPRDVIQLCNACRDAAKTNGSSGIEESDVRQALSLYSNWKLSDLQNEWSINYPFLADIFVLLADTSYLVTRAAFEERLGHIKEDLAARYPAATTTRSADALLGILYAIGLLGVVRQNVTRYYYQDRNEKRIQPTDTQFVIHPCFRSALQSTSAIDMAPFERLSERDGGLLRDRFARGIRVGQSFESARGPQSFGGLSHIYRTIPEIRNSLAAASLPDEVSEEIRLDLIEIEKELKHASQSYDETLSLQVAERVFRHLRRLTDRVCVPGFVDAKSELIYRLESSIELISGMLYRGDYGEFIR